METKETGYLNAMCVLGLDPGLENIKAMKHYWITYEIWVWSLDKITGYYCQFLFWDLHYGY